MRLPVIFFLVLCTHAILAKPMDGSNRDDTLDRSVGMETQDLVEGEDARGMEGTAEEEQLE